MRISVFTFLLTVMTLITGVQTPMYAADALPENRNAIAKVFYATCRKWDGKDFNDERGSSSAHTVGSIMIEIPNDKMRWDIRNFFGDLKEQGWEDGPSTAKWERKNLYRDSSVENFIVKLKESVDKTQTNEIVIYVHGYDNSFSDGAQDSALLSSYLKVPVVEYDWPTPKTFLPTPYQYNKAQNEVMWAQAPFTHFLQILVNAFPAKTISVVCHSMGSRLVVPALHELYPNGSVEGKVAFKELVFCSADYDSDTFVDQVGKSLTAADITRIYVSPRDKAIGFSAFLVGGKPRMGWPGDTIGEITKLPQTQVIDFTSFGGGITGHSAAHWLVSNMHKYSRPGGGWALDQPALLLRKTKH